MPNILDVYGDRSLHGAVGALREQPEYYDDVSKAEIDYEDQNTLPDSAFAWPEQRAYPISGRDMAILSALYRNQYPPELDGMEVPPQVDENFEKAAFLYDFKMPKRKAVKTASAKPGITQDDYLLPEEKKFPVRNVKEAKMMSNIIQKNAHIMGYDHLAQASVRLLKKSAEFGGDKAVQELHPIFFKYAGLTMSNKDMLEAAINRRLDFSKHEKCNEGYSKLASVLDETDFNRENLLKIAHVLEELDKVAGLRRLYDKHLLNPIESVFNTMKVYKESSMSKTAGHGIFTDDMANMVTEEQIRNILGDDVLEEAKDADGINKGKLVEVVNSLPTDMITDFVERVA